LSPAKYSTERYLCAIPLLFLFFHRNKVAAIKMPELGEWLAAFFCTGPAQAGRQVLFWESGSPAVV
jgi:hypothetical protein